MQLKLSRDYFDNPTPPEVYLCTTDKKIIGRLDCYNLQGTFKWNTYSEISFTVDRIYTDILTGETVVNPLFDKIESPRMIYLKDIGYFILQDSDTTYSDKDSKSVTAFSLEYSCANKYLENFRVNTGETDSVEVTYYVNQLGTEDYYNDDKKYKLATKWDPYEMYYFKKYTDADSYVWEQIQIKDEDEYDTYDGSTVEKTLYVKSYPNVRFYWPSQPELSLVHLILKKLPEWSIGDVDQTLWNKERKFDEDRIDVYSFLMNEVSDTFKCVVAWNTLNNTISFHEEAEDGINEDNTVQTRWDTDVYISRDNLASEINIKVSADNIKTKLKVSGADDLDIREVNLGKNYIMNLDYYHTEEWMGKELYDRYSEYLKAVEEAAEPYNKASQGWVSAYNKGTDLMNAVPVEGNVLLVGDPFEKLYCTYTPVNTAYINVTLDDTYNGKTVENLWADEECTVLIDKTDCESTYVVQGYEFNYQEGMNNFLCKYFLNLTEFPKRLHLYGVHKDHDVENNTKARKSDNVLLTLKNDKEDSVTIRVYNANNLDDAETNPNYQVQVLEVQGSNGMPMSPINYDWQKWIRGQLTLDKELYYLANRNFVIASIGPLGAYLCLAKDERKEANLEDYGVRLLQEREATYLKIFQTQTEGMFSNQGYCCVASDTSPIDVSRPNGEPANGTKWFDTSVDPIILKEYNSTTKTWVVIDLDNKEDANYYNYQRYIDNYTKLQTVQKVLKQKTIEANYWLNGYEITTISIGANIERFFQGAAESFFHVPAGTVEKISFDETIPLYIFKYLDDEYVMYLKGTHPCIAYRESQYMHQREMDKIRQETDFESFFTPEQWIRLSPFIREDEYTDDNFLLTGYESEEERLEICKELKESSAKELKTLSQPSWEFSMNMANILALPEFVPIMNQFALGNFVRINIRDGYLKRARLLEVQLSFDDLSDFSCTFGNLVTTKSEIDKHADLLAQAISAGKQVATAAGDWQRAFDTSSKIESDINAGLQDATLEVGKANGQNIEIGQYGIWGRRQSDDGTGWDPEQFRIINNRMVYTSDNFETTEAVFGKFEYKGETYYGVQAKALIGGWIDGTKISGGEIDIGDGNFKVEADGTVKMKAAEIDQYVKSDDVQQKVDEAFSEVIQNKTMYSAQILTLGATVFNKTNQQTTLVCRVYNWDEEITQNIATTRFKWIRTSGNSAEDATWNSTHTGMKTVTIKAEDVQNGASFACNITSENNEGVIIARSYQIAFIDLNDINASTLTEEVYASSPNVYLNSDGVFGKVVSSAESAISEIADVDVTDTDLNPYKILNIPVRQYQYNNAPIDKQADNMYVGLINEEVAASYPVASDTDSWNVRTMVAAMLKIIQDQQKALNELKQKVEELQDGTI